MSSENPTEQELKQGFKECETCKGMLMLEAGFDVKTSYCEQCHKHVASKEDFLNERA